ANKGLLQSETVEPDNAQLCVVTSYDYDAYGNKKQATTANCAGASGDALFASRSSGNTFAAQAVSVASTSVSIPAGLFATSSSNALTHSESREYDPRFGVVTKLTGPNGLTTSWTYDELGRKLSELRADGTSTVYYYCLVGNSSDPLNSPGCNSGNVTPAESPGSDAYAYVHTEPRDKAGTKMGAFVRIYTDKAGRELRSATESFDGGSPGAAQSTGVIVSDTAYTATGQKQFVTAPYFLASKSSTLAGSNDVGVTETQYDALGRPVAVYQSFKADALDAAAPTRSFGSYGTRGYSLQTVAYAGLSITSTNDKGQKRTEEKNANGEVIRITDASGAQLLHQRDAFGNLVQTKDPLGNNSTIAYDLRGRKLSLIDPDAGTSKYGYDAIGQMVWQQSAKQVAASVKTTMVYDQLGRMKTRTEAEYTSTWVYDSCAKGVGKLCGTSTTRGLSRSISYDALGRPISSSTQISSGSGFSTGNSFTSLVDYDANTGRLSTQTYPSGVKIGYNYTARGYLASVELKTAATVKPLPDAKGVKAADQALAIGYKLWTAQRQNAWGKLEQQQYGNGVISTAAFDSAMGRVTDLKAGPGDFIVDQHYAWDSLGQLTSRADNNGDTNVSGMQRLAVNETFSYADSLNRLTQYTVSLPATPGAKRTVNLQYNALGLLLSKSDVGNYAYNAQGGVRPHALKSVTTAQGTTTYGYDDNGNLASADNGKYTSLSHTSFNLPDSGSGLQGPAGKYAWQYDENHARVLETHVTSEGTRQTWYLHPDNQGGLAFESEVAPNGTVSNRHYISAGGQTIAVLVSTGALPANPATAAPTVFVKLEYWHKDHLGSLISTTDHTGTLTARYAYDPFGKRRYLNGSYDEFGAIVADWSSTLNAGTDRGFTGHEHLDDLGIVHMNGRLFDPRLGVFLQADPMLQDPFNLQNYNRYGYCYNNPMG
ncbi:RHS repeat-associated core domain-containing protein, partial [Paucibacter sp. APW11]